MKVNVKEIAQELQTLSDEDCFFYNKITGELEYFNSEQENPNDFDIDEIDEDENFVALPSKYSIDDYRIMKDFMFAQKDKKIHDAIYDAIHQKGAFRKFRQVVEQTGILQKWYEFKDKEYGNQWDWLDWTATMLGGLVGQLIQIIIILCLL